MSSRREKRTRVGIALALSAALAAIGAAPAAAAPELEVNLSRDVATVYHSDERVDYLVGVQNSASEVPGFPEAGDTLSCVNGKGAWFRESTTNYSFEFRWYRDGAPVTAWAPGSEVGEGVTIATYVVQGADAGASLQCLVKGTNGAGSGSAVVASQPAIAIAPAGVAPPAPNGAASRRPAIAGSATEAGDELTCTAPTAGWSGSPSWSFEWLRDGDPAPGAVASSATESEYTLTSEDLEPEGEPGDPGAPAAFQCVARATNAGGSAMVESILSPSEAPAPEFVEQTEDGTPFPTSVPQVERATNTIAAPLSVEVELPGGAQTYVYETSGNGWSCDKSPASGSGHAKAICTTNRLVKPDDSLPPLRVAAALGPDAPDLAVARAVAFGGGAAQAASDQNVFAFEAAKAFGFESFSTAVLKCDGSDHTAAGGHPCRAEGDFALTRKRVLDPNTAGHTFELAPIEQIRSNVTDLPRGFVGNPTAIPALCETSEEVQSNTCPATSRIGGIRVVTSTVTTTSAIYAIVPERGTPAQFAFTVPGNPPPLYTLSAKLRPEEGYAASLELAPSLEANIYEAEVTLCGFGVKAGAGAFPGCKEPGEPDVNPKPLITNPTRCEGGPVTRTRFDSWENPGHWIEAAFAAEPITECEKVPFEPEIELAPSVRAADSPSGLDVELGMPTEGLEDPEGIAQAQMKKTRIVFPEGMAINPSAGHGLNSCSAAQVKLGTNDPISCPESAKIGTIEIDTPLLEETLKGNTYIARQGDVGGALIGLYLVFESKKDGILVKVPGRVDPDPRTGRLTVTVDESPEAPFSAVRMRFPGGPRANLLTPPACGTYAIDAELFPWTGGASVKQRSTFEVDEGPNGGPCPSGELDPTLNAGVANPLAGSTSPFSVRLHRPDGSDRFTALGLRMPAGLTAYLRGVPYCPEATLAGISPAPGAGRDEIDDPSCPAASQIGRVIAGAGAGPDPFYVDSGRAYLAGPYKGAPLSIAVVAPAVAGPLDLGNVVVRNAVYVDPATAEISVVSDPIPHILHGLLLDVRDVRVLIDRPSFTLNPSGCEPKQVQADVKGLTETGIAQLANRFQVGNCAALGFEPRVALRLFGGTNRGDYQGVRAVVRPRPGDSNISRTVVRFPRSAFVAQEHIRTVCTRVQFKADACPKGSIYGKAVARSPLIDYPLRGNVYLRSSDNTLPDAVADLRGPAHQPVRVEVAIRNDSVKGALRNTVQAVPDAPVSYFRLQLRGGRKGLIVNSRNICGRNRARVAMGAHNGRRSVERVAVFNKRCAKQRRAKRKAKRSAAGRAAQGKSAQRGR